jgi:hypothetical protein
MRRVVLGEDEGWSGGNVRKKEEKNIIKILLASVKSSSTSSIFVSCQCQVLETYSSFLTLSYSPFCLSYMILFPPQLRIQQFFFYSNP